MRLDSAIDRINGAVRVALREPVIKDKLVAAEVDAVDVSLEQFELWLRAKLSKWEKGANPPGLTPERSSL